MTTTDPAERFRAAIAGAGLPADLAWSVQVSERRKHLDASVGSDGVVFRVPASVAPETVADAVRRMRGRLAVVVTQKRDRGARIIRKDLVNGEGFPLLGTPHRLQLVDDSDTGKRCRCQCGRPATIHPGVPIAAEPGHPGWSGQRSWQLTLRRDAASVSTVIEWYRAQGQAWLDGYVPDVLQRAHVRDDLPTWSVRPHRAGDVGGAGGSWGRYRGASHSMSFHWMIFQFPAELVRHIVAHEVAHATLRGGGHGEEWQLVLSRLSPQWRELEKRARSADGLTLWAGELGGPILAAAEPVAPFVSGWGALAGGAR